MQTSEPLENPKIFIEVPTTTEQLDRVRTLMRAFIVWHRHRYVEDIKLIDEYFDATAFEEELALLPGKYAPPHGMLMLAFHEDIPAGCVAVQEIDPHTCEMKKMFVYTHLRGKGVGKALAQASIDRARAIGYRSIRLTPGFRQYETKALYHSLGFRVIEPYYELPEKLRNWVVFMELNL
ncbi:GNAT family N-acetyltransferase [Chamaesiphon sp. OTE_20_metabat_361]|uniref:GNAT family N-acetyltransferase n=2 Tax=unclassified Chamaesiphon TaxID=2620921 RepID=UPI00286C65B4|nr:GNAT family N-acetyltransferase [Chamaesiphon sp. OTE_20_metabat_361]